MNTTSSKLVCHSVVAAAVALLAAAPAAQAARVKHQAAPAPVVSPYTYEITAGYDFAINDLYKEATIGRIHTYGADITGVFALDANRAYTLRIGYRYGDKSVGNANIGNEEWEITRLSIMPGYRLTKPLNENTNYFIGGNLGLVRQGLKRSLSFPGGRGANTDSNASTGIGYSGEIGLIYKHSEKVSLLVGYQLSGSTNVDEVAGIMIKEQLYHTLRAGVSVKF